MALVKCKWCTWNVAEWAGPERHGLKKLREHVEETHKEEFREVRKRLARWDAENEIKLRPEPTEDR